MPKVRHGFIALAILGGPASLILAHQKLTETLPQDASNPSDVAAIVQQAYSRFSEAPQAARPSQCEDYIRSFDECAARFSRLQIVAAKLRQSHSEEQSAIRLGACSGALIPCYE
jgi:hypothetical protein